MEYHVDCTMGRFSHGMYTKWSVPRLFQWADKGEWDRIPSYCQQSHRGVVREIQFRHKYAPADSALHRLLRPLCCASSQEKKGKLGEPGDDKETIVELDDDIVLALLLPAVQAIVNACPCSLSATDMFGRTPLHMACFTELTPPRTAAAVWILESSPKAALCVEHTTGQTGLHKAFLAKDVSGTCRKRLVEAFIKADPHALSRIDHAGKTPEALAKSAANISETASC